MEAREMKVVAGVLLIYGGVVMAFHELFLRYELGGEIKPSVYRRYLKIMESPVTALAARVGLFITAGYSVYYAVYHFGWVVGLISWVGVTLLCVLVCKILTGYFPLVLMSGFVSLVAAYYIALNVLYTFP
jgi:hypothetical protein